MLSFDNFIFIIHTPRLFGYCFYIKETQIVIVVGLGENFNKNKKQLFPMVYIKKSVLHPGDSALPF